MRSLIRIVVILFFTLLTFFGFAQETILFNFKDFFLIKDFTVESAQGTEKKINLIALDTVGKTDTTIQGNYSFVINGFIEELNFKKGIASVNILVDNSTFLYVKHENKTETRYKLYYVLYGTVWAIPLWIIIIVPLLIVLLTLVLRRYFILFVLLIFIGFFLFNGFDFASFVNLLKESASSLFR